MSGSFRTRGNLTGCNGNSRRQKEEATLVCCLQKAATLLDTSADDVFFTRCVCQKIYSICWQVRNAYGEEAPVAITNGQPPEELIKAVKNRIVGDGTICVAKRAEIIEGLNAVLAMING